MSQCTRTILLICWPMSSPSMKFNWYKKIFGVDRWKSEFLAQVSFKFASSSKSCRQQERREGSMGKRTLPELLQSASKLSGCEWQQESPKEEWATPPSSSDPNRAWCCPRPHLVHWSSHDLRPRQEWRRLLEWRQSYILKVNKLAESTFQSKNIGGKSAWIAMTKFCDKCIT